LYPHFSALDRRRTADSVERSKNNLL